MDDHIGDALADAAPIEDEDEDEDEAAEDVVDEPEPSPVQVSPPYCGETGCDLNLEFTQPMARTGHLHEAKIPTVTMQPEQAGQWSWTSPTTLTFSPDDGALTAGTRVDLTVEWAVPLAGPAWAMEPGWETTVQVPFFQAAGKVASWAVVPGEPRFVGFLNHFTMQLGQGPMLLLYDQPVDREQIGQDLSIKNRFSRPIDFEIIDHRRGLSTLDEAVDHEHVVAVQILEGLQEGESILVVPPSTDDKTYALTVRERFTVDQARSFSPEGTPLDHADPMPLQSTLRLDFNNPVELEKVKERLKISPAPEHIDVHGDRYHAWVYLTLKPGVDYQITLDNPLVDELGNPMSAPFDLSLRSQDLLPELHLPAAPITAEANHPLLEMRGRNLTALTVDAYEFEDPREYAAAMQIGAKGTCAEYGLNSKPQRLDAPELDVAANQRGVAEIDLPRTAGLRCVEVSAMGEGSEGGERLTRTALVQTSDIGLTAKISEGQIHGWVTGLHNPRPRSRASVSLLDASGKVITASRTNSQGIVQLDAGDLAKRTGLKGTLYLLAESGEDRLLVRLQEDRLSQAWRYGVNGATEQGDPMPAAMFTERGAYRPNEVVHGVFMAGPEHAGERAAASIVDARGQTVSQQELVLDAFGTAAIETKLKEHANVGRYTFAVTLGEQRRTHNFQVEEYRVPTFEVDVEAPTAWERDESGQTVISASYLHGGSLDGRAVEWSVHRSIEAFSPARFPGYVFHFGDRRSLVGEIARGSGRLDGQGQQIVNFTPQHPSEAGPMRYFVEASVTDVDRQNYAGRRSQVIHPASFYVGVKAPTHRVFASGDTVEVPIAAVSPEGDPVAGVRVRARMERVDHHVTTRLGGRDTAHVGTVQTLNRPVAEAVGDCQIITTKAGATCRFAVDEAGAYQVRAWAKDAEQREVQAGFTFTASGDESVAWPRFDRERIEIRTDKDAYRPGETAKLIVQTPFTAATALLTLERDGVMEQRVIEIKGDTPEIEIPITGEMAPNVFASVALVRGRIHDARDATGFQTGAPAFRLGVTELKVEPIEQRLAVAVSADREVANPGDETTLTVTVADHTGRPVRGQVALMVVDEAVLGLTGYQTPDPVAGLFPAQTLGVRTADSRLELPHARRARNEILFPGGDGGDEGGDRLPNFLLRSLFQSTAYFNPAVPVGADGQTEVTFTLPDNTTAYRVMAVAIDEDGRAGSADDELTVRKPLILQAALPRFIYPDDTFSLEALIYNGTEDDETAEVSLIVDGFQVTGEVVQTADVDAEGTATVRFPVTVHARRQATVQFQATMGEHTDAVEITLPVRDAGVRKVQVASQTISGDGVVALTLPDDRISGTESVEIVASTTALTELKDAVGYLMGYPNGCIEQTTSRAYPLVVLEDLLPEIGVEVDQEQLRKYAEAGIRRILSFQTEGGGLSYWPGGTEPHAFATSFGLTALIEAKKRGYDVPDASLSRMADFLEATLRKGTVTESIPHGNIADGDTRALFVMTLGRLDRPQPAYINQLWQERDKLTPFGLAFLGIAASEMDDHHPLIEPILAEVRNASEQEDDEAWFEGAPKGGYSMDSPLRTHASALLAYAQADASDAMSAQLLNGLLARRRHGMWGNTQENVFGIMGVYTLTTVSNSEAGEAPDVSMRFNGAPLDLSTFQAESRRVRRLELTAADIDDDELKVEMAASGLPVILTMRADYDVALTPENRKPTANGAAITRRYETLDGRPITGDIPLGALVRVRLTVTTEEALNYIAIDDLLPAGLEPLNAALKTTQSVKAAPLSPAAVRGAGLLSYQEIRDHRVAFYADALPAGTVEYQYVARATTPGTFLRPPASVEAMYKTEIRGSTEIDEVTIR
ncbi:MAG: alpha-2-macroglobulin family protein [Myxococcota bacterium]